MMDATHVSVRDAVPADLPGALASYARNEYQGGIAPGDQVVVAATRDGIVGAGRLAHENGVVVLRGMFLDEPYRGRGVGSQMLARLIEHIAGREAWLITSPKRFRFYTQGQFMPTTEGHAPTFLVERAQGYAGEHGQQTVLHRTEIT